MFLNSSRPNSIWRRPLAAFLRWNLWMTVSFERVHRPGQTTQHAPTTGRDMPELRSMDASRKGDFAPQLAMRPTSCDDADALLGDFRDGRELPFSACCTLRSKVSRCIVD